VQRRLRMTNHNTSPYSEEEGFGLLPHWSMWGCGACGRTVMSASRPVPMFWVKDHQCRFSKLDRQGNLELEKEFKNKYKKDLTNHLPGCTLYIP